MGNKINNNIQEDLFSNTSGPDTTRPTLRSNEPLPFRARPVNFEGYFGQEHVFKRYPFLRTSNIPSLVIWGPPGTGKTTLAHILAKSSGLELYTFNAVLGGVNELKKLIASATEMRQRTAQEAIIFVDEIHRFNKAQQDALLPYVEQGSFIFIGATTENPRSSVNKALLSRVQIIELKKLSEKDLVSIVKNVSSQFDISIDEDSINFISDYSNGDARNALNILELVEKQYKQTKKILSLNEIKPLVLENAREYDRNKDRHYDVISAFIKSMRGSDPNSALLWLAVMLDGGEDPVFIARRLVIFASEDVGNADPQALMMATACLSAVSQIGMPEARINLAQATTYLAATVKSNAAYLGINEALEYVRSNQTIEVPKHLKNFPPQEFKGKYQYPHNFPHHFVKQQYSPNGTPNFYRPTEMGREKNIKDRLDNLWS
ncbi:replication-associated recombination protein A [Halobacteriovorax sp. HLS]|uniref:replication-associated recombination protein A n=1 Tax=Halobacteriovorax sp. HLS TaxID=2234000 RepID=UPI000FD759DC|nr:replication-associated recombination protein A [Halobacteriovorax sp. HLS]